MTSLRTRGQQTPIEVVTLPDAKGPARYGLISGWRRLSALRRLHAIDQDDRFATVQARIITPADAQDSYVTMVEENEIRAGLSLYEKGRIALRAVHEGVFPTPREALRGLFGSVSRSRRSKIGTFLTLVEPLDRVLRFPAAIPEKLGLKLAKALQEDHRVTASLTARLRQETPDSAEAELRLLNEALAGWGQTRTPDREGTAPGPDTGKAAAGAGSRARPRITGTDPTSVARRLEHSRVTARFDREAGQIVLAGGGVTPELHAALKAWLRTRRD